MIRHLKRTVLNCIYCRMRRSSVLIGVVFLIFVYGNYRFLHPFLTNEKLLKTTDSTLSEVEKLHEEYKRSAEERREMDEKNEIKNRNEMKLKQFPFRRHVEVNNRKVEVDDRRVEIAVEKKVQTTSSLNIPLTSPTTTTLKTEIAEKTTAALPQPTMGLKVPVMAVLVISCNRVEVKRTLDLIFQYRPKNVDMPVIVSQDCGHKATADIIKSYGSKLKHIQQPDLGNVRGVPANQMRFMTYYKISRHYKWALTQVFSTPNVDSVIIVEDDLDIAPDFFDYFLATRPLLEEDHTLFCVSAWNDNGKSDLIDENAIDLLYRSDFFPGLGWLLTKENWKEFAPKWPLGFWDDWIRQRVQRKERACIRPEISRTRTFGRKGASNGQFFDEFLQYIKLNKKPYPFLEYDLNHLLKSNYDKKFVDTVYSSPEYTGDNADQESSRITYNNEHEFEQIARKYGMMKDFKEGVPRTAYLGIVTIFRDNRRIYIAPKPGWKPY